MTNNVKPGYKLDRDSHGLTRNERDVLRGLSKGKQLATIGAEMGLSKQRAAKLAADLVVKGWLFKGEKRGQYMIEAKRLGEIGAWKEESHDGEASPAAAGGEGH